eukprot:356878-Chlamydomonas_euryale.AAC.8
MEGGNRHLRPAGVRVGSGGACSLSGMFLSGLFLSAREQGTSMDDSRCQRKGSSTFKRYELLFTAVNCYVNSKCVGEQGERSSLCEGEGYVCDLSWLATARLALAPRRRLIL